jgi:hypothetical protein
MRHKGEPSMLLDIASYARRGPGRRDRLSPAEIELIARTVNRTPEVMVKVLTRGGQDLRAVRRHLSYLNRGGELELETDDGDRLAGKGIEKDLLDDWDLDLEEHRRRADLGPRTDRRPPKLVHKIVFSMPPGTPPEKVLAAVKNFAREEFALKHRYAFVLHTDEPHPHVHMAVKAVSEQGVRLHIRKATLGRWRSDFAGHLRSLDVPANATERRFRGETTSRKHDAIYRAHQRGQSSHMRERVESVASELMNSKSSHSLGSPQVRERRASMISGWRAVEELLRKQEQPQLADQVARYVVQLPPARTEQEWIASRLRESLAKSQKWDHFHIR